MSGIFGGGGQKEMRREAAKAQATARQDRQASTEEAMRAQQRAERGTTGGRSSRNLLMGDLGAQLKGKMGG